MVSVIFGRAFQPLIVGHGGCFCSLWSGPQNHHNAARSDESPPVSGCRKANWARNLPRKISASKLVTCWGGWDWPTIQRDFLPLVSNDLMQFVDISQKECLVAIFQTKYPPLSKTSSSRKIPLLSLQNHVCCFACCFFLIQQTRV